MSKLYLHVDDGIYWSVHKRKKIRRFLDDLQLGRSHGACDELTPREQVEQ